MKKLLLSGLLANCLFINLYPMEQQEPVELKQPRSLVQMLVPQVAKLVDIYSPQFETLPLNMKEQILAEKGTLEQILDFAYKNKQDVTINLIQLVPMKFFKELISGEMTIEEFVKAVKQLPARVQQLIFSALATQVLKFMNQDRIMHVDFTSKLIGSLTTGTSSGVLVLPIDFRIYADVSRHIWMMVSRIQLIHTFDYYLALFIGQQLQSIVLDSLAKKVKKFTMGRTGEKYAQETIDEGLLIIDKNLLNKLQPVLDQLNAFVVQHAEKYPVLKKYLESLNKIFKAIINKEIIEILLEPYVYDREIGAYKQEKW